MDTHHMYKRIEDNRKVHGAYMTKTSFTPANTDDIECPDPHLISEYTNVTDFSPSMSEINRRVERRLDFASPYFEQLHQLQQHDPKSAT
jgi:hypothetical protein